MCREIPGLGQKVAITPDQLKVTCYSTNSPKELSVGAVGMAQHIKPWPVMPASPMGTGSFVSNVVPADAPGEAPGEAVENGSSVQTHASTWETQMELLAPGFSLGPSAAIVVIRRLNQQMDDLLYVSNSAFHLSKINV